MNPSPAQLTPPLKEAIDWMVTLDSGNADAQVHSAFERWLTADPRNQHAWQALQNVLVSPFNQLAQGEHTAKAASRALRSSRLSPERRKLLRDGTALALFLGLGGSLAVQRRLPIEGLFSDFYSGTAERKRFTLPDGSVLILNARSIVDVQLSATLRRVQLKQGELSIEVASDPTRPLEVWTAQGRVRALGTRFNVRQMDGETLVGVQQHSVHVQTQFGPHAVVQEGCALRFTQAQMFPLAGDQSRADAWISGLLDVEDESLGTVIDALRPYRYGLLRVSPAAAKLRVFGVFSLDDSDRALQSLAEVLPIGINRYGQVTLIDVQ